MKSLRKFIRALLVTALLLAVFVPTSLYVVLSTSFAQEKIRVVAERELSNLLGTNVEIGRVQYRPFNTISISGVRVDDGDGHKVLGIARVSARFELWYFLRTKHLIFDYAVVDAPDVSIRRAGPNSPLNIQPIIDRLSKKDKSSTPTAFDLKIGTIILHDGIVKYNVDSLPSTPGHFNVNHINVKNLDFNAYLRHASNEDFSIELEHFSFIESSGFELTDLTADVSINNKGVELKKLEIELPDSHLALEPMNLTFDGLDDIPRALRNSNIRIATAEAAVISSSDFKALAPIFDKINLTLRTEFAAEVSPQIINLEHFVAETAEGLNVELSAKISMPVDSLIHIPDFSADIKHIVFSGKSLAPLLPIHKIPAILQKIENASLSGSLKGNNIGFSSNLDLMIGKSHIKIDSKGSTSNEYESMDFSGDIDLNQFALGHFTGLKDFRTLSTKINADGEISKSHFEITAAGQISSLQWKGHNYHDVNFEGEFRDKEILAKLDSFDPDAAIHLNAFASLEPVKAIEADINVVNIDLEALNLCANDKFSALSGIINSKIEGSTIDDFIGNICLKNMTVRASSSDSLFIENFSANMTREARDRLTIESDFLNGSIEGVIHPSGLKDFFMQMAETVAPSLITNIHDYSRSLTESHNHNDFTADFTLDKLEDVCRFFNTPVAPIYPVDLLLTINSVEGTMAFTLDAPYLRQGDKIIDSTILGAYANITDSRASLYASTHLSTKKGPMTLAAGISGADSRFDTHVDWEIERAIPLNGVIDFYTELSRSPSGTICVNTQFNPGQINFGEDVWNIAPASVAWCDKVIEIDGFDLKAGNQEISINGRASESAEDVVNVELKDIHMISIFETLEIDNAMIGGTANGSLSASQALSKMPVLTTEKLHVDSISYNHCVIGDADASARWDNEKQSIYISADIKNPQGQLSYIYGDIFPLDERLDLYFDATNVRVGFMQPFMAAFSSEVSGYGSGKAHLFGTFKNIDMEGDIFADNLSLKIDFTNTVYTATDSVHITPGRIELSDITIRDVNGHTALLNGVLTHDYFHFPKFNFQVTDARDFLCYNISEAMNPDWYGTIYGNGSASVTGAPGIINIGAKMSTAPGSTFTFVLSDRLDAEQYSFITFRDVTELTAEEKFEAEDIPESVKEFRRRLSEGNNDSNSDYNLDFRVDITPDAAIILVMDPVGGDRIRAFGSGDMRLTYNSTENDIRMYGSYTLDRGSYNFTLQDIIIKEFTIDPGSSITFRGDPYSAQLNIEAAYQLNANLTDLDESFSMDKDLNRTNVPVQALLKVSGDMRQPDIDFDLRFPTLTSDTYRKVRSIISTDDMMNRQIIYLLALNRFYTPDYMESTTKGNELFSVASSTISSQLSNILGKLSDKWSIAPNLRSDRGDFSDVEVDVALSSRLLNNRLLLNGNLGYRDKSLNTNQFIGDFDVEYLLTPKGNWRLKGYSRYNDQNYYVRTAPTTQGVGIMFRRDFDSLFPTKKKNKTTENSTIITEPSDSIIR